MKATDKVQEGIYTPEGVAQTESRRRPAFGLLLLLGIAVFFLIVPFVVDSNYAMSLFIQVLMMAYFATAWGLVAQTGQLSFGHAAFVGLGAYTSTILFVQYGVNPWLSIGLGGTVSMFFGALIGVPTLRLRGVYFALATLAFAISLQIFVRNTFELGPIWLGASPGIQINLINGGDAPSVFQFSGKNPYYFIILGMLAGILALSYFINQRRMGYYWTALRGDEDAAEALGINVAKYRIQAFLLSCFLTGAGGVFYAQYLLSVDPRRILDLSFSLEIVAMGVVGGWQAIFGPFIGAIVLVPAGDLIRARLYETPQLTVILYGIIIVLFIQFFPNGLSQPIMRLIRRIDSLWRGDSANKT